MVSCFSALKPGGKGGFLDTVWSVLWNNGQFVQVSFKNGTQCTHYFSCSLPLLKGSLSLILKTGTNHRLCYECVVLLSNISFHTHGESHFKCTAFTLCFCYSQRKPVKYESYHSIWGLFGVTWQPYVTFTTNNSCWETLITALSGSDLGSHSGSQCAAVEEREGRAV